MQHVAITCHLEKLWPRTDAGVANVYFGVNLSSCFVGSDPPAFFTKYEPLLYAWDWTNLQIQVYIVSNGATVVKSVTPVALQPSDKPNAAALQTLITGLRNAARTLRDLSPKWDRFLWFRKSYDETPSTDPNSLRHLLGYVSSWAAPVPQALNLSLCFLLPQGDLNHAQAVYAAPIFNGTVDGQQRALAPRTSNLAQAITTIVIQNQDFSLWSYTLDGADTEDVKCYLKPWNPNERQPQAERFLQIDRDVIRTSPTLNGNNGRSQPAWYSDDWAYRLEDRFSEVFDLPRLLIEAARQFATTNLPDLNNAWIPIREAVRSSLRDRAGVGLLPAPEGPSLFDMVVAQVLALSAQAVSTPASQAVWDGIVLALRDALERYNQGLTAADWVALIAEAVPTSAEPTPPSVTRADPTRGVASLVVPFATRIAWLDRLARALQDEGTVSQLLMTQWEQAAENDVNIGPMGQAPPATFYQIDSAAPGRRGVLDLSGETIWILTFGNIGYQLVYQPIPGAVTYGLEFAAAAGGPFAQIQQLMPNSQGLLTYPTQSSFVTPAGWYRLHPYDKDGHDVGAAGTWPVIRVDQVRLRVATGAPAAEKTFGLSLIPSPAGAGNLRVGLFDPQGNTLAQKDIALSSNPLHFRLTVTRDPASDHDQTYAWKVEVSQRDQQNSWATLLPQTSLTAVGADFDAGFLACDCGQGGGQLTLSPPSALEVDPQQVDLKLALNAWDQTPELNKAWQFWQSYSTLLSDQVLPQFSTVRLLARGNIGRVWQKLLDVSGAASDLEGLVKNLRDGANGYFTGRLDQTTASDFSDYTPKLTGELAQYTVVYANFEQFIQAFVERAAREKILPSSSGRTHSDQEGDSSPTAVPHTFTLQVSGLGSLAGTVDATDMTRRRTGAILLLHQAKQQDWAEWRCLNMGKLVVNSGDGSADAPVLYDKAVVPYRIVYQSSARRAFISYDNHPLIPPSPVAMLTGQSKPQQINATNPPLFDLQLGYKPANDETTGKLTTDWAYLPALKFGQSFQAVAFAIHNCGALPVQLAGYHPSIICPYPDFNGLGDVGDALVSMRYSRRVGVGKLRVSRSGSYAVAINDLLPEIPIDVAPLAREVAPLDALASSAVSLTYYNFVSTLPSKKTGALNFSAGDWSVTLAQILLPSTVGDGLVTLSIENNVDDVSTAGVTVTVDVKAVHGQRRALLAHIITPQNSVTALMTGSIPDGAEQFDLLVTAGTGSADPFAIGLQYRFNGLDWQGFSLSAAIAAPSTLANVQLTVRPGWTSGLSYLPPYVEVANYEVDDPADKKQPLLLLVPGNSALDSFQFALCKPTADLSTWDRWLAMDQWNAHVNGSTGVENKIKGDRIEAWARSAQAAQNGNGQAPVPGTKADPRLDDPALTNYLLAELLPVRAAGIAGQQAFAAVAQFPPNPNSSGDNILAPYQSYPVQVNCRVGSPASLVATGPQGGPPSSILNVLVPEGEVWELRLNTLVAASWFDDTATHRFNPAIGSASARYRVFSGTGTTDCYRFSDFRLLIEGAATTMPSAESVWLALQLNASGSQLVARLDPGAAGIPDAERSKFAYIKQVDLGKQVWRWSGRPLDPFPLDQDPNDFSAGKIPDAVRWDGQGFGDRDEADRLAITAPASPVPNRDANIPPGPSVVLQEDVSNDPRAHYYRLLATIHSRYEALFQNPALSPVEAKIPEAAFAKLTGWKRAIVPCRWQGDVPKPHVKLAVPLTQGNGNGKQNQSPGILVVLNEPWCRVGGIAETLAFDIEVATLGQDSVQQYGPDPILSVTKLTKLETPDLPLEGPIGHTFDTNADVPLFVASSFLLRPRPDTPGIPSEPWALVKMRFRRSLAVAGGSGTINSDPTAPYWIQLLPDASQVAVQGSNATEYLNVGELSLIADASPQNLVLVHTSDKSAVKLAAPDYSDGSNVFSRLLLVTQMIHDAAGRSDAERYLGLYRPVVDGPNPGQMHFEPLESSAPALDPTQVAGRLLEVQKRRERLRTPDASVFVLLNDSATYSADGLSTFLTSPSAQVFGINVERMQPRFSSRGTYTLLIADSHTPPGSPALRLVVAVQDANYELTIQLGSETPVHAGPVALSPATDLRLTFSRGQNFTIAAKLRPSDSADASAPLSVSLTPVAQVAWADPIMTISVDLETGPSDSLYFHAPEFTTADAQSDPWTELFPPQTPEVTDARARIVRVSPRIMALSR